LVPDPCLRIRKRTGLVKSVQPTCQAEKPLFNGFLEAGATDSERQMQRDRSCLDQLITYNCQSYEAELSIPGVASSDQSRARVESNEGAGLGPG
jgi:hypothetical protein